MNPSQNPSALRSKKIITDTLLSLMKEYPYKEITIKQILIESQLSRKTFYRNFLSKDDVLSSHMDTVLYEYLGAIREQGNYSILPILDIIFPFCVKNRELLFMLRDNQLLHLLLMKLNRIIKLEHERIASTNHPLSQYIVSFNIGGIWNIIATWIENDMKDDAMEIKQAIAFYLANIKNIDLRDI